MLPLPNIFGLNYIDSHLENFTNCYRYFKEALFFLFMLRYIKLYVLHFSPRYVVTALLDNPLMSQFYCKGLTMLFIEVSLCHDCFMHVRLFVATVCYHSKVNNKVFVYRLKPG